MKRQRVMEQLQSVVAEHDAARRSVAFLLEHAASDPSFLRTGDPTFAELRTCLKNLERTYLVRLFAVFEEAIREVWADAFGRRTTPRTKEVVDGCASRRRMPPRNVDQVHEVREYRNSIIHGAPAKIVSLGDAKSRLCRFLAWMPENW